MNPAELLAAVLALEPRLSALEKTDRASVLVPQEIFTQTMQTLRNKFSFDMLCAHTAIDRLASNQMELVYQLYSTGEKTYLMVSVKLDRTSPEIPSVCSLWAIAQWQEREVFDLFGVLYSEHPDMRRLLLEDDWQGFPLRKDYKDDFMLGRPW